MSGLLKNLMLGGGGEVTDPAIIAAIEDNALASRTALGIGMVSVSDHGAVGDGTTNDTTAIQAAIEAAKTAGKSVFVPSGTYKITSALTIYAGTTLRGENMTSTIIRQDTSSAHGIVISMPGPLYSDAVIENLTVRGVGKSTSTGYGIFADGTAAGINQSAIRDVEVQGFAEGMRLSYWNNSVVERCRAGRSGYESTIGIHLTGNSNSPVFTSNSIMSSTTGFKVSGGGAVVVNGMDMGGGGQTKCIEIAGAVSVDFSGLNLEYWCVGDSASNIAIDNQQAGSTISIRNSGVRNGAGSGSGYSLAVSTGTVYLENCSLALTYTDSGNAAAITGSSSYNLSVRGVGTTAAINTYDSGVFKGQSRVSPFRAEVLSSGTTASAANRSMFYFRQFAASAGYDDTFNVSIKKSDDTYTWANLLDYYTDKRTAGGTAAAFVGASNTFAKSQNFFNSDNSYITGIYCGDASASTASTKSFFGLCRADGYGPTGTLNGDTNVVAKAAGSLNFATSASGTQVIRGKFKANGQLNLTSLAIPNYADDTAADAALASGDLYTTTAGGRTVFRKP